MKKLFPLFMFMTFIGQIASADVKIHWPEKNDEYEARNMKNYGLDDSYLFSKKELIASEKSCREQMLDAVLASKELAQYRNFAFPQIDMSIHQKVALDNKQPHNEKVIGVNAEFYYEFTLVAYPEGQADGDYFRVAYLTSRSKTIENQGKASDCGSDKKGLRITAGPRIPLKKTKYAILDKIDSTIPAGYFSIKLEPNANVVAGVRPVYEKELQGDAFFGGLAKKGFAIAFAPTVIDPILGLERKLSYIEVRYDAGHSGAWSQVIDSMGSMWGASIQVRTDVANESESSKINFALQQIGWHGAHPWTICIDGTEEIQKIGFNSSHSATVKFAQAKTREEVVTLCPNYKFKDEN